MNSTKHKANRLIKSTSPYLLQHAYNPVDWYEWGEEAFAKAKKEDKPVLVSIGYSSCHWCHVMERESFEDADIAQIMNEFFVCIKVDREERPDIDNIYMEAVQAMGLNGGWPLNVFLTSDQKPFYGGTYFPPQSWAQLLTNIHKNYQSKRLEIETSADELKTILSRSDLERFKQQTQRSELIHDLDAIYSAMSSKFDTVWGGLDKAPKFIMPSSWQLLLRYYHLTGNKEALQQVILTLKKITMGGIHDQVGGGFARYSVDAHWFAPHFEKMLYDNAQLMSLYSEAYSVTKDEEFKSAVEDIFTWLQREMTHPKGGFYSALDADSEGIEGKFYVWKKSELTEVLGADAELIGEYFSVQQEGNWEDGSNIFIRNKSDSLFLKEKNVREDAWKTILSTSKEKLLTARNTRPKPGLDDKIITSWNAMTVSGLTDAYRALGDEKYLKAAQKNMAFLEGNLMKKTTLYRSFKNKHSKTTGFLDDYAFVIQAYINLYQVTFHEKYLDRARMFLEYTIEHFFDAEEQFFHFTGKDGEELITRKKEIFDNVIPSSNSVMARNLFYLGTILDRPEWKKTGTSMTASLARLILSEPNYMSNWAMALIESKHPIAEVVFIGEEFENYRKQFHRKFHPYSITMGARKESSLPLLEGKVAVSNKTTVFVCFDKTCKLPVTTVPEAEKQLIETVAKAD